MKKNKFSKILTAMCLAFAVTIAVPSVVPQMPGMITAEATSTVKISKTKATLIKGQTLQLKISGTSKKVTWSSSSTKVAKVSTSGKVTAVGKGTATITAKIGSKKYTCKVTVESPSLSKTSLTMINGKTYTLKLNNTKQKVTWTTSDKSIATVSSSGKITAKKEGTVKIIAKILNKSYTCKVSVKNETYGTITGNITYYYNQYRGHVADTGAYVVLVPKDGSAKNANLTSVLYTSAEKLEKYHIYVSKVDGMGYYTINHVATGEYRVLIISNETTSGEWFDAYDDSISDAPDWYYDNIAGEFYWNGYLSKKTAMDIVERVMMFKYYIQDVSIYKNETTTLSHDFGITYI